MFDRYYEAGGNFFDTGTLFFFFLVVGCWLPCTSIEVRVHAGLT